MKLQSLKNKLVTRAKMVANNYVLYARKSTEAEDRQCASIDSQLSILRDFAKQKGLTIVKEYTESKSAKLPYHRPHFTEMLEMFNGSNPPKGILCWKFNRLERNPEEEGKLRQMLSDGRIEEIVTPCKTFTVEDSDFNLAIDGAQAQRFIRDLSRDTRRGLNEKLKKGIPPILAPTGYVNDKEKLQGQKTISPSPIYFKLVRKLFDIAMTRSYSIAQIY